jgi:hypothetical protein
MKKRYSLYGLLTSGLIILAFLFVMPSSAKANSTVDTLANIFDYAGMIPEMPINGDTIRNSVGLFNCIDGAGDDLAVANCIDTHKDDIGSAASLVGADIPSWFWDLLDLYIDAREGDFWGIVAHFGEAAVCAVAQVMTGGAIDVCGAIKALADLASSIYDLGSAVVDWLKDFGAAAVDLCQGIGLCSDDQLSCNDRPDPGVNGAYAFISQYIVQYGLTKIEDRNDSAFGTYVANLVKQGKDMLFYYGTNDNGNVTWNSCPRFLPAAVDTASELYIKAVKVEWANDMTTHLLADISKVRMAYAKNDSITGIVRKLANNSSDDFKTAVFSDCKASLESSFASKKYLLDRFLKDPDMKDTVTKLKFESHEQWCGHFFTDNRMKFQNAVRLYVHDKLCPGPGTSLICPNISSWKKCNSLISTVYAQSGLVASLDATSCSINLTPPELTVIESEPKGNGVVSLKWKLPTDSSYTDVMIQRKGPGESEFKTIFPSIVASQTGISDGPLKGEEIFLYRIGGMAFEAGVEKPATWSPEKSIKLSKITVYTPLPPENLTAVQIANQPKVKLTWNFNFIKPTLGDYEIKGYRIYRTAWLGPKVKLLEKEGKPQAGNNEYLDTVPNVDTKYSYDVVPYNNSGESVVNSVSVNVKLPTELTGRPPAPYNLTAGVDGGKNIILTWKGSSKVKNFGIQRLGGKGAKNYYYTPESGSAGNQPTKGDISLSYTDKDVTPGTSYTYQIWAKNTAGSSDLSNKASVAVPISLNTNVKQSVMANDSSNSAAAAPSKVAGAAQLQTSAQAPAKAMSATAKTTSGSGVLADGAVKTGKVSSSVAQASSTVAKPQALSDITANDQITIGGKPVRWQGTLNLDAKDAQRTANGLCAFSAQYAARNIGAGAAGGFRSSWTNSAVTGSVDREWTGMAAGMGATQTDTINLKPGSNLLTLSLDSKMQLKESNENNNQFRVTVNVTGQCGATPVTALPAATPKLPVAQQPVRR